MSKQQEILDRLATAFTELPQSSLLPLSRVITSLVCGAQATLHTNELLDQVAFDYLTSFVLTHHALSDRPLKKENFEHAIEYIFRRQGKIVPESTDPTRRGADIMADGIRYSLKTSSSKGRQAPNTVDVSKFAESRWLRDPLRNEDFPKILQLCTEAVRSHLAEYDEILMLQNHSQPQTGSSSVLYRLYQIPKSIFEAVYSLNVSRLSEMYLSEKNRRGSGSSRNALPQTVTAPLYLEGALVTKMSLDGSVEKLRFLSISLSACKLLAEWKVAA